MEIENIEYQEIEIFGKEYEEYSIKKISTVDVLLVIGYRATNRELDPIVVGYPDNKLL